MFAAMNDKICGMSGGPLGLVGEASVFPTHNRTTQKYKKKKRRKEEERRLEEFVMQDQVSQHPVVIGDVGAERGQL